MCCTESRPVTMRRVTCRGAKRTTCYANYSSISVRCSVPNAVGQCQAAPHSLRAERCVYTSTRNQCNPGNRSRTRQMCVCVCAAASYHLRVGVMPCGLKFLPSTPLNHITPAVQQGKGSARIANNGTNRVEQLDVDMLRQCSGHFDETGD